MSSKTARAVSTGNTILTAFLVSARTSMAELAFASHDTSMNGFSAFSSLENHYDMLPGFDPAPIAFGNQMGASYVETDASAPLTSFDMDVPMDQLLYPNAISDQQMQFEPDSDLAMSSPVPASPVSPSSDSSSSSPEHFGSTASPGHGSASPDRLEPLATSNRSRSNASSAEESSSGSAPSEHSSDSRAGKKRSNVAIETKAKQGAAKRPKQLRHVACNICHQQKLACDGRCCLRRDCDDAVICRSAPLQSLCQTEARSPLPRASYEGAPAFDNQSSDIDGAAGLRLSDNGATAEQPQLL